MISAFSRAFGQLSDKSLRKVVWIGIVGSLAIFFVIWFAVGFALFQTELFSTGWLFGIFDWIVEKLSDIFGGVLVIIATWFLFPSIVTLIVSFFLEQAALAVENKHYPDLPASRGQDLKEILRITLKFTGLSIVLNILALPIYVVFFFLGPLNLFVFYGLNGYLLGREFFELIAHRRMEPLQATHLRGAFQGQMFLAGVIITFLMTIPVINLVAPVVATAAMVHLVQGWRNRLDAVSS
jgi:CysZ protein